MLFAADRAARRHTKKGDRIGCKLVGWRRPYPGPVIYGAAASDVLTAGGPADSNAVVLYGGQRALRISGT